MPELVIAAPKKSKMLLLVIRIPLLPMAVVVVEPLPKMPLVGRFAPAGPMLLLEIVLLSLPFAGHSIGAEEDGGAIGGDRHRARSLNVRIRDRIVGRAADEANGRSPGRSRNGRVGDGQRVAAGVQAVDRHVVRAVEIDHGMPAVVAPEIVRATPPAGTMLIEVYEAAPEPLALRIAVAVSFGCVATNVDADRARMRARVDGRKSRAEGRVGGRRRAEDRAFHLDRTGSVADTGG